MRRWKLGVRRMVGHDEFVCVCVCVCVWSIFLFLCLVSCVVHQPLFGGLSHNPIVIVVIIVCVFFSHPTSIFSISCFTLFLASSLFCSLFLSFFQHILTHPLYNCSFLFQAHPLSVIYTPIMHTSLFQTCST